MQQLKKAQNLPLSTSQNFLSLCLSLFISHPLFTHRVMLRWLWGRPGWDTLFAFFWLIWVGHSPLCRLGSVKKWPCGKLGCDLPEQQQLPAWPPGLQNLTPWKMWGSLSHVHWQTYVYLRGGACICEDITAGLTHGVATSWLPWPGTCHRALLCAFSLC